MPMTFFECFNYHLGCRKHDLGFDTLGVVFTNREPDKSNDCWLENLDAVGEPHRLQNQRYAQEGGRGVLRADSMTIIASRDGLGPFQYVVLFNLSTADGPLIGYESLPEPKTLRDGESIELMMNNEAGLVVV